MKMEPPICVGFEREHCTSVCGQCKLVDYAWKKFKIRQVYLAV